MPKKIWTPHLIVLMVLLLSGMARMAPAAVATVDDDSDFPVQETETVRQTYPLADTGTSLLDIDTVWGSIDVVGTSSNQVQVVITKTIRAESKETLEKAKTEVTLAATRDEKGVRLYVDGPFRCRQDCDGCYRCRHHEGYVVQMDFQVQAPRRMNLSLRTVNEGHIKVEGVSGDFQLRNVNGSIDLLDADGSGKAKTVNGGVKVTFRGNPKANSEFSTINGPIEIYFAQDLAADFRFKTFNGGVYSDYELGALPAKAPEQGQHNGRFVFRADRFTGGRVGSGGPEIKIENLNGDIRVLQRHASL